MSQFSYVYGIWHALEDIENEILLSADNRNISIKEFLKLKEPFIIYYTSVQEYFPLANIYLAENKRALYLIALLWVYDNLLYEEISECLNFFASRQNRAIFSLMIH